MPVLITMFLGCDPHALNFKDTGEPLVCGPGTHEDNGQCLPDPDTGTGTETETGTGTGTGTEPVNAAPTAPIVAITPDDPTQLSELTCTVTTPSTDPDGDTIRYRYAWFVRGVESSVTTATLPETETAIGDTWTCQVTPSDGALEGPSAEASVELRRGYSEVSVGSYHACGLSPNDVGDVGEASCWGDDSYGEGSPPSGYFAHVYTGYYETCGQDAAGTLSCWGTASWGMATPPAGPLGTADLGWYSAYAVAADGTLSGWGFADPAPEGTWSQVASGEYDFCALDRDGLIDCWGVNPNGEGDAPAGEFTALSGGYHNFCALDTDGYPICWGFREEVTGAPREVLVALSVYDGNACGIREDGSVLCWGDDEATAAPPSGAFRQVSVGTRAACAVDLEGRTICWGSSASNPPSR